MLLLRSSTGDARIIRIARDGSLFLHAATTGAGWLQNELAILEFIHMIVET